MTPLPPAPATLPALAANRRFHGAAVSYVLCQPRPADCYREPPRSNTPNTRSGWRIAPPAATPPCAASETDTGANGVEMGGGHYVTPSTATPVARAGLRSGLASYCMNAQPLKPDPALKYLRHPQSTHRAADSTPPSIAQGVAQFGVAGLRSESVDRSFSGRNHQRSRLARPRTTDRRKTFGRANRLAFVGSASRQSDGVPLLEHRGEWTLFFRTRLQIWPIASQRLYCYGRQLHSRLSPTVLNGDIAANTTES